MISSFVGLISSASSFVSHGFTVSGVGAASDAAAFGRMATIMRIGYITNAGDGKTRKARKALSRRTGSTQCTSKLPCSMAARHSVRPERVRVDLRDPLKPIEPARPYSVFCASEIVINALLNRFTCAMRVIFLLRRQLGFLGSHYLTRLACLFLLAGDCFGLCRSRRSVCVRCPRTANCGGGAATVNSHIQQALDIH